MISYETIHTIRELVEAAGTEYKDHVVLRYLRGEALAEETFCEVSAQCRMVSAWVADKSDKRPVRVAMMGANTPLYVKLFMGVMCGGGIAIPMDPQMKTGTVCGCMNKAEADIYIYDQSIQVDTEALKKQVPSLKEVLRMEDMPAVLLPYTQSQYRLPVTASDCATIIFTSGTTGEEKGVMLSHGNLIDNVFCTKQERGRNVKLNILPLHHAFCINGDVLLCFANCATLCMNGDASKIVENMVRFEPNIVNMVPMVAQSLYNRLMQLAKAEQKAPEEIKDRIFGSKIEKIVAGGAHLPAELVEKYQKLGIFLCQGYGMSECSPSISSPNLYRKDKAHTAGKVVFRCKTRVVDGELQVKSPSVMMGYVNAPELTAQAITEDGWLRTGDIGYEDEEGFLYIMGRKKNLIILSNGNNVSPEQIEKLLLDHQIISQALVYGEGNSIVAELYPDPDALKNLSAEMLQEQIAAIVEQVNASLPFYKQIMKHILRRTPMQMTASGKIIRAQRARAEDLLVREKVQIKQPENVLEQKLWNIVADVLGHEEFGIDTDLFEAGLDSLGCVNMLAAFAEQLDFHMELDRLLTCRTILMLEAEYQSGCLDKAVDYTKRAVYPLSDLQKYFAYLIRGNTTSNIPILFKLDERVDLARLADAIRKLFVIHPVLNDVVQMFEDKGYANFRQDEKEPVIEIYELSEKAWEKKKAVLVRPYLYTPDEPLYHIELYRVGKEKYLFFDIAHIISDGVSLGLLIRDMNQLYAGQEPKKESYTFYEYLLDCEAMRENHTLDKFYLYFMELFEGVKIDRTILNRAGKWDWKNLKQATLHEDFDLLQPEAVEAFCTTNKVSENTLFVTAFSYCVSLFHDQDEIVTTSINHGRNDNRFRNVVGCIFKTYNYRYRYHAGQHVLDMLQESAAQLIQSFGKHLDTYHADEMFFQYQGDLLCFDEVAGAPAEIMGLPMDALPFHLSVMKGKKRFVYELRYWTNRYEEEMLRFFMCIYEHTLLQIITGGELGNVQSYLPKAMFPKGVLIDTKLLQQKGIQDDLQGISQDMLHAEVTVRDRYGYLQPYGAWGTLYVQNSPTRLTARILLDQTVDFLEDGGRTVMLEGITGRQFCDLAKLEAILKEYPGVEKARCYVKMADALLWRVAADIDGKTEMDEDKIKAYLEQKGYQSVMPILNLKKRGE